MPWPIALAGLVYAVYREFNKNKVNERREEERDEWRLWSRKIASLSTSQHFTDPKAFRSSGVHRDLSSSSNLEIQDDNGETVVSISEICDPMPRSWVNVHESRENPISRLNPLLSAIPLAAIGGDISTTRYMRVNIAGSLTRAADGDGFRAWSMKVGGRGIEEHARLFSPNELGGLVTLGAFWQIASIAVAQKHLYDINKKLESISRRIEEISTFLKDDRISKVLGARKYFTQVFNDIGRGLIMLDESRVVIENQCAEISKVEDHIWNDLKREVNKIKEANLGESFNRQLQDVAQLTQQLFACIETKLLGNNLMAIDGRDESFVDNRLYGAQRDITYLKEQLIRFADYMFDTLSEDASFWGNVGKFEEVLDVLEDLRPRNKFEEAFGHVYDEIEVTQNILEQRKAPQEILLKVNGGNIDGFAVTEGSRFAP